MGGGMIGLKKGKIVVWKRKRKLFWHLGWNCLMPGRYSGMIIKM
jgi:hypothetical protein